MKKKHWYSFSFADGLTFASTYTGYTHQTITLPLIQKEKENADVPPSAVLIACSYLGYMTKENMVHGYGVTDEGK